MHWWFRDKVRIDLHGDKERFLLVRVIRMHHFHLVIFFSLEYSRKKLFRGRGTLAWVDLINSFLWAASILHQQQCELFNSNPTTAWYVFEAWVAYRGDLYLTLWDRYKNRGFVFFWPFSNHASEGYFCVSLIGYRIVSFRLLTPCSSVGVLGR